MCLNILINSYNFDIVSEVHVLEDVNNCIRAAINRDADNVDRTAGAIRGRTLRVCNVVEADMDTYEPNSYTDKVRDAVRVVRSDG